MALKCSLVLVFKAHDDWAIYIATQSFHLILYKQCFLLLILWSSKKKEPTLRTGLCMHHFDVVLVISTLVILIYKLMNTVMFSVCLVSGGVFQKVLYQEDWPGNEKSSRIFKVLQNSCQDPQGPRPHP